MSLERESHRPFVGVLLVNLNQWELTDLCIKSVLRSKNVRVVVGLVDNNSTEPVPDSILSNESVLVHRSNYNSGFIAANNKAYDLVMQQKVDYVMLLNNDTEVEPEAISLLAHKLATDDKAGLVTPAIQYAENHELLWHAGGRFVPWKMGMTPLFHRVNELPRKPVEVDLVSGCAMMMRADFYPLIAEQDPDFFIYHEDTEQSIRTKKLGYRNFLVPKARIVHHVSVTTGGVLSPFAVYFTHRNRFLFARRNLEWYWMILFTLYYLTVSVAKTAVYPANGRGKLVRWLWLATIHGITGRISEKPAKLFPGS